MTMLHVTNWALLKKMFTTYKRGEIGNQEQNALFTPSILLTIQTTCNYANLLFTKVSNITSF